MQTGQPFNEPDPWSSRPPVRPNRKGLLIALIFGAVLLLGVLNAKTGAVGRLLGLGPKGPVIFIPSFVSMPGGVVAVQVSAADARGRGVRNIGNYLHGPRVELFDEDRQLLAAVRLEAG